MDALKHIGIGRVNRGKYRDLGLKVQSFNSQSVKVWSSKICFIAFESIVNIYQTTGVSLIKPFFIRKIFITLHRHLYVRCIAIEAYSFRKRRTKKRN